MEKFIYHLTKNGILRLSSGGPICFYSNDGKFKRLSTWKEWANLVLILPQIEIVNNSIQFEKPILWKYLGCITHSDYTNYVPLLGSNGGNYSYHYTTHFFERSGQYVGLELKTSSCTIGYDDELHGGMISPNNSIDLYLTGIDWNGFESFSITTQGQLDDDEEYREQVLDLLNPTVLTKKEVEKLLELGDTEEP